jgi:hypothetical protein
MYISVGNLFNAYKGEDTVIFSESHLIFSESHLIFSESHLIFSESHLIFTLIRKVMGEGTRHKNVGGVKV